MIQYSSDYWKDVNRVTELIPNVKQLFSKRIMITGGTGMICSAVAEILFCLNHERNANIDILLAGRSRNRMMERFYCFSEGRDYSFVEYNATKNQELSQCTDYIIHGASNANPLIYTAQPVETMLANFLGLNNLLEMGVKTGSKRLLYVSSSEVYGNKTGNQPYKEKDYGYVDILNQRACYPSAKRAAETLCTAYGQEYGLDTVIVRPGHIYGPTITETDSRASAQFTQNAIEGEDIVMKSAGMQMRSYCYVLDCASAILTVLLNGKSGDAYNISNKASVCTISDIALALAHAGGQKVVYENATDEEKKGYNLMSNSSLDAAKLEKLGWRACFDLEEGAEATVKYMKKLRG